jgi:hypothetical protein
MAGLRLNNPYYANDPWASALGRTGDALSSIAMATVQKMKSPEEKALMASQMNHFNANAAYNNARAYDLDEQISIRRDALTDPRTGNLIRDGIAIGEQNYERLRKGGAFADTIAGVVAPAQLNAATAASEGKMFDFKDVGVGNQQTGTFQMNDLGNAKVGSEKALANERNAGAGRNSAQAGLYKSQQGQYATVPMDVGGVQANVPLNIAVPAQTRETVATTNAQGKVDAATAKNNAKAASKGAYAKLTPSDSAKLPGEIANILGFPQQIQSFDAFNAAFQNPGDAQSLLDLASQYYTAGNATTGLQAGNLPLAVRQAQQDLGIQGFQKNEWYQPGKGKVPSQQSPIAQTVTQQPQQPAAAVPPPAQRVVGQTYQTPKGPMVWRGQGWEPAR